MKAFGNSDLCMKLIFVNDSTLSNYSNFIPTFVALTVR